MDLNLIQSPLLKSCQNENNGKKYMWAVKQFVTAVVSGSFSLDRRNNPKSRVPFTSQPDFREILVNGEQNTSPDGWPASRRRIRSEIRLRLARYQMGGLLKGYRLCLDPGFRNKHRTKIGMPSIPGMKSNSRWKSACSANQTGTQAFARQDHSRPGYFRCVAMSACAPQITISRAFQFPLHAAKDV